MQMFESDYDRAIAIGKLQRLASFLSRRCNGLLSILDIKGGRVFAAQRHSGVEQISVASIVGSINRARDFDNRFNPLSKTTRSRWDSVNRAHLNGIVLPPVELQKVNDSYYVRDGHHRISVARFHGVEYIDAVVIDSICPIEAAALGFV